MFIKSKKITFPLEMQFALSIPVKEDVLNVPVRVRRIAKSNGYYDSIGVEVLDQPQNYLDFIRGLADA